MAVQSNNGAAFKIKPETFGVQLGMKNRQLRWGSVP